MTNFFWSHTGTVEGNWILVNDTASFGEVDRFASTRLSNGNMYVIGGYSSSLSQPVDWVYESSDNGLNWAQVSNNNPWAGRYGHRAVTDSSDNIYITGGKLDTGYAKDVWKSSDGGVTWTEINSSTDYGNKYTHGFVIDSDDNLYVMGGYELNSGDTNDVWKSTDGGATWTEVNPNASWKKRRFTRAAIDSNDNLYIIGGSEVDAGSSLIGDVWKSTDGGDSWTEINSNPLWNNASRHCVILDSFDNMYLFGGVTDTGSSSEDILSTYKSTDGGATWVDMGENQWSSSDWPGAVIDENDVIYAIVYPSSIYKSNF